MTLSALSARPSIDATARCEGRRLLHRTELGYRLDDGSLAQLATSCLLQPLPDDQVLVAWCGDVAYITDVLSRAADQPAELTVAGATRLRLAHARLDLQASERMNLHCLQDLDLQAVAGSLTLSARNLVFSAIDALLEQVRHRITRAEQVCMRARGLFKLHGKDSFITADDDVRIDGERINVG